MSSIYLNSHEYPVTSVKRTVIDDFMPDAGDLERRKGRPLVNFRTEGELGYAKGWGYSFGPAHIVSGGFRSSELRLDVPGQITLPLILDSETEAAGDLSGEVAAAGRMTSCETTVGMSSGLRRMLLTVGNSILRNTSDSDFSLALNSYAVDAGVARIYCSGRFFANSLEYYGIGTEDPTTDANRGLKVSTDASVDPIVFADVETSAADTNGPGNTYWFVSIDSLQRTYICWQTNGGAAGTWGDDSVGRVQVGYITYADALSATPTIVYSETTSPLHKGCQVAGVIGNRIWIIDPIIDAQATPGATKRLGYIDIGREHLFVEVPTDARGIRMGCVYQHPDWGWGIVYSDVDECLFWTDGFRPPIDMGTARYQGNGTAVLATLGFRPLGGGRLAVLLEDETNSTAQIIHYIPNNSYFPGYPNGGSYGGSWYPYSKKISASGLILAGGTTEGCLLPYCGTGERLYFVIPSASNSTFYRQKNYFTPGKRFVPLPWSVSRDDFDDGPLTAEFPLYDPWGGVEETGLIVSGFYQGGFSTASGAPTASETVLWEYTTDQSTYPDFTTFTSANATSTLASGGASVRQFGLRVTLNRGSTATVTPNGAIFVVRGLKIPATRQQHVFKMAIDGKLGQNVTELTELQSRLETARDASAVLLEYDTYSVYVNVKFEIEAIPREGKEEEKITVCTISCTEVS